MFIDAANAAVDQVENAVGGQNVDAENAAVDQVVHADVEEMGPAIMNVSFPTFVDFIGSRFIKITDQMNRDA